VSGLVLFLLASFSNLKKRNNTDLYIREKKQKKLTTRSPPPRASLVTGDIQTKGDHPISERNIWRMEDFPSIEEDSYDPTL